MANPAMVSSDNNQLPKGQLQLILNASAQDSSVPQPSQRPLGSEQRKIAPGRVRPNTGKASKSSAGSRQECGSVVSSIIGNMYTPSTTARTRSRNGSQFDGETTARTRNSERTRKTNGSRATKHSYRSQHSRDMQSAISGASGGSARPTTSEVLLAKKQLKMEGMIRKLLVQQQEADCTILELSEALGRLDPAEKDRIDLHEMTAAVREKNRPLGKGGRELGIQHLNGAPQEGSLRKASPWHLRRGEPSQDIVQTLCPEGAPAQDTSRSVSSKRHSELEGRNAKSLLAPATLFQPLRRGGVTDSPNNNPSNILNFKERSYVAPTIPQHFDSRAIAHSVNKWGTDTQADAWETSSNKWHTSTEDIHGYAEFQPGNTPTQKRPSSRLKNSASRPASAFSVASTKRRGGRNRPASATVSNHGD